MAFILYSLDDFAMDEDLVRGEYGNAKSEAISLKMNPSSACERNRKWFCKQYCFCIPNPDISERETCFKNLFISQQPSSGIYRPIAV